jgi:RNA polymerase sigma-70 factor (ECF subfamily)
MAGAWRESQRLLSAAELRHTILGALDHLPDAYRTVYLLCDVDELDRPTVARMLGTTPSSVRVRLHRARQALVTLLKPILRPEATTPA